LKRNAADGLFTMPSKKRPWVPFEVPTAYEFELLLFSAAGKPLPMDLSPPPASRLRKRRIPSDEPSAKGSYFVIPAKAGIQNRLKTLDSGARSACPE
jgi:hypothetical protein